MAKKNGVTKRKRKDPGVPNTLPFKDEVIQEAQAAKEREQERKAAVREVMKKRNQQGRDKKLDAVRGIDTSSADGKPKSIAELAKNAQTRGKEFLDRKDGAKGGNQLAGVSNLRSFYKDFQKVWTLTIIIASSLATTGSNMKHFAVVLGCRGG